MNTPSKQALLFALFATMAWGCVFPVLKDLLRVLDPFWLTTIRYASALLLVLLAIVEGPRALRPPRAGLLLLLGTIGFGAFNFLLCLGLERSSPERAAIIMATTPILGALLAAVRTRTRIAMPQLITIAVAFAGVVLVVTQGDLARLRSGGVGVGDGMILLGALSWVIYSSFGRELKDLSPLRFTALSAAFGTLAIVSFTLVGTATGHLSAPTPRVLLATLPGMLYTIIVGTVIAVLAWNAAIARLGPPRTIVFMNVVPITAFAIGIARGAHFPAMEYTGAALTIAGLIAYNVISARASN